MIEPTTCPVCNCALVDMRCDRCGREWYELDGMLASKPRRVRIVAPLVPGAKIDDCIKVVEDAA